jgi:hypothetical protein
MMSIIARVFSLIVFLAGTIICLMTVTNEQNDTILRIASSLWLIIMPIPALKGAISTYERIARYRAGELLNE